MATLAVKARIDASSQMRSIKGEVSEHQFEQLPRALQNGDISTFATWTWAAESLV